MQIFSVERKKLPLYLTTRELKETLVKILTFWASPEFRPEFWANIFKWEIQLGLVGSETFFVQIGETDTFENSDTFGTLCNPAVRKQLIGEYSRYFKRRDEGLCIDFTSKLSVVRNS